MPKQSGRWWVNRWIEQWNDWGWNAPDELKSRPTDALKVDECTVFDGVIRGKVSGTQARPFQVSLQLRRLSEADAAAVVGVLAKEAAFEAALLNDRLPESLESKLMEAGIPLFPAHPSEWSMSCSCKKGNMSTHWGDKGNRPCEHMNALNRAWILRLEQEPILLFKLRGLSGDTLISELRMIRSKAESSITAYNRTEPGMPSIAIKPSIPVECELLESAGKDSEPSTDYSSYWSVKPSFDTSPVRYLARAAEDAPISRVSDPDFWTKERSLQTHLIPVYQKVSERALRLALTAQMKTADREDD